MSSSNWEWLALGAVAFFGVGLVVGHDRGYSDARAAITQAVQSNTTTVAEHKVETAKQEIKIITEYVDREKLVYAKGETIIKEVPVYVSQKADSSCAVPLGFVSVYDRAILASAPQAQDPAPGADSPARGAANPLPVPDWAEQPSGVPLSTIASVGVANTLKYNALAARFNSLTEWATTQCYEPE